MSKYFAIMTAFSAGAANVTDLAGFRAHVEKTLPGFSMSLSWPAEKNSPLGYVNGFINPPKEHASFKPVFCIGSDEKDFVKRMNASVPRLLRDLAESESELTQSMEYVSPDRKAAAKAAREALKATANGAAPGPAQPVANRGARKAIRDGKVMMRHVA